MKKTKIYKINIPDNICLQINGQKIIVREDLNWFYYPGSNDIVYTFPDFIKLTRKPSNLNYNFLEFSLKENSKKLYKVYKRTCPLHIKLLKNKINGNLYGFKKILMIAGEGYKFKIENNFILLFIGFHNPLLISIPKGILVNLENSNKLILTSNDKNLVGTFSSQIREKKPIEPYKGKGIYFSDEKIILKSYKKIKK